MTRARDLADSADKDIAGTLEVDGLTVGGNIAVTGTVDGRDVATDGTKLDGVEASADVTDATNVANAGALMANVSGTQRYVLNNLNGNSKFAVEASSTGGSGAGGAFLKFKGSNGTAVDIAAIDGSMTNGSIGSESGILSFFTTNAATSSEKMRIASNGITTVGGTSGAARLNSVAQNWPENALGIYSANIAGQTNFAGIAFFNQDTDATVGNVADIYTNPTGTLSLTSASNPAIQLKYGSGGISGGTPALTVDSSGHIGIGTTTPTLDSSLSGVSVSGSSKVLHIHDTEGAILKLTDPSSGANRGGQIAMINTHMLVNNCEADAMSFGTGNTERMRIAADGTVSISQKSSGNVLNIATHIGAYEIALTGSTHANIVASNGANPFYIQNLGNGNMHFQTNATDRLVISNNGYITKPSQPIFSAYRNGSNVADNTVIVWTNTTTNVGSHYNTSNGRFTAPVAGKYFFSVFAMGVNTQTAFGIRATLNGTPSGTTWAYTNVGTGYKTLNMSFVMTLNATDFVEIMTQGGTMHSTANFHNNFCGYLVA